MPVNYQEGKIYKLYNTVTDDIYVGSTTRKLCEGVTDHGKCVNNKTKKDRPLYQAFRDHGIEHFFIELIEKCPCNDIDELRKKEGEWVRQLKPHLNMTIAGRSCKDYYNDNKEHIAIIKKQYYNDNKDQQKAYKSKEITCECGCMVARGSLLRYKRTKRHEQALLTID